MILDRTHRSPDSLRNAPESAPGEVHSSIKHSSRKESFFNSSCRPHFSSMHQRIVAFSLKSRSHRSTNSSRSPAHQGALLQNLAPLLGPRKHVQSAQTDTHPALLFSFTKLWDSAPSCTSLQWGGSIRCLLQRSVHTLLFCFWLIVINFIHYRRVDVFFIFSFSIGFDTTSLLV